MKTKNEKLEKAESYISDGKVCLKLTYTYEKEDGIHMIIIPKVDTTIQVNFMPPWESHYCDLSTVNFINTGDINFPVCESCIPEFDNINHVYFADKLIKPKPREMTLKEIEEKLGYKVKIVNKGE